MAQESAGAGLGTGLPLLIGLAALGAAAMNLLLPAMPQLQAALAAGQQSVRGVLTSFLVGAALAQLTIGALADAWRPRPLLLASLLLFSAGSTLAALADSMDLLSFGRLLQGFGGASCLVLAEAVVARAEQGGALARRLGALNAGMALAVMAAPLLGAAILSGFGWRSLGWVSAAAGLGLLLCCWRTADLELERPAGEAGRPQPRRLPALLRSRRFLANTLCAACVMANYFCLAAFGPHLAITLMGLDQLEFGLFFGGLGLAYITGNLLAGPLYLRLGEGRVTTAALLLATVVGILAAADLHLGGASLGTFLSAAVLVALATGLVLPGPSGAALAAVPQAAGTAAGLLNAAIYGLGALVTEVVAGQLATAPAVALAAMPAATALALLASLLSGSKNRNIPAGL